MKVQYIELGNRKWNILIYYNCSIEDFDSIADSLEQTKCSKKDISRSLKVLRHKNTGLTFSNSDYKMSIVCISQATSISQFISTAVHELKHVQSHICSFYKVPEKGEEAAYLIGYIAKRMFKMMVNVIKEYV